MHSSDDAASKSPSAAQPAAAMSSLKASLNLPVTAFAMRGNLAEREPKQLAAWDQHKLWKKIQGARAGQKKFVLHDGPPYANGALHHGHILNKVLKDIVVKDRTMRGYDVSYVPGWDCHGLPIEVQVDKELKGQARTLPPLQVHEACNAYAARFVDSQAAGFARLGVFADWTAPYRTMDFAYEAQIVRTFAELVKTKCIYRGLRPVHWCTIHQTALAEAEIEYETKRSPSIYVGLRLHAEQANNQALAGVDGPIDIVIWTTTPWSLPGNVAVAVHPEATYLVARTPDRHVIVAKELWPAFVAAVRRDDRAPLDAEPQVARTLLGAELAQLTYDHPFLPRKGVVLADDYVALDTGTGAVHTAPAHGVEDFELARRNELEIPCPVTGAGVMTSGAGQFANLSLKDAGPAIVAFLDAHGALFNPPNASIEHRYAHCWRCHKPIITRATQQWFLAMDRPLHRADGADAGRSLREEALAALETVTWVPAVGIERIRGMLKGRPDWCLSRQRIWGVPVPVAYCERCESPLLDAEAIERVAGHVAKKGARTWYTTPTEDLFGARTCAACGHGKFRQENDILDVWFDSGSSYAAVLDARGIGHKHGPPADLYLEGSDQHRGWFHSSLLTRVASRNEAPYRQVLTHGFVVDGAGKKLSKSLGNAADPFLAVGKDGAELFRLWVASEDYQQDVRISPAIMRQIGDHYRKVRNTLRYLLGNLHGFAPDTDVVAATALQPLDSYMLLRHREVVQEVLRCFAGYQFHTGTQQLLTYCTGELSSFYLDVLKDRLYASAASSPARRAAQSVLYVIARDLLRLLAPVLCFTAEEAWQLLPRAEGDAESIHLMVYPQLAANGAAVSAEPACVERLVGGVADAQGLRACFQQLLQLRAVAYVALEQARQEKRVGSSTEARLTLQVDAITHTALGKLTPAQQADFFIVSEVVVQQQRAEGPTRTATVARAEGNKCPRCWLYRTQMVAVDGATDAATKVCLRCSEALTC